jgi:fumarate reductase flavoprotein subunit
MPVLPMQHYSMGGIRVTPKGQSVNIKGLFSCGEAACWDMHGFNRLGGNSVSETVVAGMIIGNYFADFCKETNITICTDSVQKELDRQNSYLDNLLELDGDENIYDIKDKMRIVMQDKVGIFRNGKDLADAVEELKTLLQKTKEISITKKHRLLNQELEEAYKVPMMLKVALCVAKGARDRTESRGAHYREDYLKRDDKNWLNRTISYWENEDDLEPTLKYEELDIMKMEIPPAFRGYGRKGMIIEHPLSKKRQDEVDKIVAEHKGDRYELQDKLMPYELQPEYKSKNERIGDRDE